MSALFDGFARGELLYGVAGADGVVHKSYRLGPLRVDQVLQFEAALSALGSADEHGQIRHRLDVLAARIRELGDLPRRELTGEYLSTRLEWPDLLQLQEEVARLDSRLATFRADLQAAEEGRPRSLDAGRQRLDT